MKFSYSELKKFLNTELSPQEIANSLNEIGHEVESLTDQKAKYNLVIVAEIKDIKKHENASKLSICTVFDGSENLQIICGASNVRVGMKVALAKIGAELKDISLKIKKTNIRGVDSFGMLCSSSELGLDEDSDGILELDKMHINGSLVSDALKLNDYLYHIAVTPNRGDCLNIMGIARDLSAYKAGSLLDPLKKYHKLNPEFKSDIKIDIENNINCPLYSLIEIKNIKNLISPDWLKDWVSKFGLKSINAIVDITNYICFTYGNPMHAFDASKIGKNIYVKNHSSHLDNFDSNNETNFNNSKSIFKALDDRDYRLDDEMLVIESNEKIQALAGIIGSKFSAIDHNTNHIVLECALFNPVIVSKAGRKLKIHTDARHRFERGIDVNNVLNSLSVAANMILEICKGSASEIIIKGDDYKKENNNQETSTNIYNELKVKVNPEDIYEITSTIINKDDIELILINLGFKFTKTDMNYIISVPSYRHDIKSKEDIAEEIIRIYGYDKIPEINLQIPNEPVKINKFHSYIQEARRILSSYGYDELITMSFASEKHSELFGEIYDNLKIINPISSDLSYMRSSIITTLLNKLLMQEHRFEKQISIFEIGPIFKGTQEEDEKIAITALKSGLEILHSPHHKSRKSDIFDIKRDLEILLMNLGINIDNLIYKKDAPEFMHKARSGSIYLGKTILGYFGEINPITQEKFGIKDKILCFEIILNNIPIKKSKFGKRPDYKISKFPGLVRDFAFVLNKNINSQDLVKYIKNIDNKLIENVYIFDQYEGEQIEDGKKSIALEVVIHSMDKTLNDEEIHSLSEKIISSVNTKFESYLRK